MNDAERRAFLDRPLTAVISTAGVSGGVHGVPAWYSYEDGGFVIWTDANRRWVRNIKHDSRVSVVVAEHDPPYAAFIAHGSATVATDAPDTDGAIRAVVERYLPAADVEQYVKTWASLRTIVRITPALIRSWGRGY